VSRVAYSIKVESAIYNRLMDDDHYRAFGRVAEASLKVERSEFIGIGFPIATEASFFAELESMTKRYHGANHLCWAFRLRQADRFRERSADAGEPAGTAGKPILSVLLGGNVADSAIVVVRYFGGVKLGTGGLARAYRSAAQEVMQTAPLEDRYLYERLEVKATFQNAGVVYRLIDPPHVVMRSEVAGGGGQTFELDVRLSRVAEVRRALEEKRLGMT
jgi:uncharacterized YigZ family protein